MSTQMTIIRKLAKARMETFWTLVLEMGAAGGGVLVFPEWVTPAPCGCCLHIGPPVAHRIPDMRKVIYHG